MGIIGRAIARGIIERGDAEEASRQMREEAKKLRELKALREENADLKKQLEECQKLVDDLGEAMKYE